jgi:hypothetical protein
MNWALAAVILAVIVVMASNASKIPWLNKMRRLQTGSDMVDWMAPDGVVEKVKQDYMLVFDWMQSSPVMPFPQQWRSAPEYLTGAFLRRYQQLLIRQRSERDVLCYGVLRADHDLEVRGFSADGSRCWLTDSQSGRRIATYAADTHERVLTQDMGGGTMVMQMRYDSDHNRWKIEALIQELPTGWERRRKLTLSAEHSPFSRRIGRDS